MLLVLVATVTAMVYNLADYIVKGNWGLVIVGSIILILALWVVLEGANMLRRVRSARAAEGADTASEEG